MPATPDTRRSPGWTLWLFRVAVALELVSLLLQTGTAGELLEGVTSARVLHGGGSTFVHVFGLVTLVAAILVWRPGRGPWWPSVAGLVLLLAGFAQSAFGGAGQLALHVPVGVTLVVLATWLLVWSSLRRPSR
ncbi:MAG: hypothetical protein GEV10_26130 [Streptosporangiales bacterium]|nr:hypothetical protein [Streptosporangiales bacterium]